MQARVTQNALFALGDVEGTGPHRGDSLGGHGRRRIRS